MGKTRGFIEHRRELPERRPVDERVRDFGEVEGALPDDKLREQGARCMGCGIPFCHSGCPLGNIIPDWNDLVYRGRWSDAIARLHSTHNFPEVTGRVCPAPCEEACVLNINDDPVTIKQIEKAIADHAFAEAWVVPRPAARRTGRRVAIVGSGPAGLACAQQLARAGHDVTVFERDDRPGGLLRYGIPDFKLEKHHIDRRIAQMEAEGVVFRTSVNVGVDVTAGELREAFDAICLAGGATQARDLPLPGRELRGIHLAMELLTLQNRVVAGETPENAPDLAGKHVVVLGGGDTGSDCVGTSHRLGAASVTQVELLPRPPATRTEDMPWPSWPMILRTSSSHEEGGERDYAILTKRFEGDEAGAVRHLHAVRIDWRSGPAGRPQMIELPGTELQLRADTVLLALGFTGPEPSPLVRDLGVTLNDHGAVAADGRFMTSAPSVFACGDMRRGQSLVVWAIWEGREAARHIDEHLMGRSALPTSPPA